MKALEDLFQHFKGNTKFQFWSITYDTKPSVAKTAEQFKLSFPVASTSFETCNTLNFGKGYPTTIVIDENAKIVFFKSGGSIDPMEAEVYFKSEIYPFLNGLLKSK